MQHVVNTRDIIKSLTKNGLIVEDKQLFNYYIKNFNYNTFIYGYSEPFLIDAENNKYDPEARAEELIELYRFDRDMGNHILRYILVIEKMINTNVAYEIINSYNIRDKCLFKFDQRFIETNVMTNIKDIEPRINYYNFVRKIVKYLPSSKITKKYAIKNCNDEIYRWKDCPLDLMCLTWSFATAFSLFISLDDKVRDNILANFNLKPEHFCGFVDFLKNSLHLRNVISHNNVIYSTDIPYKTGALNNLYQFVFHKCISNITLVSMMELIQYFSDNKTLLSNTKYYLNKIKINPKFKNKINLYREINEQVSISK